MRKALTAQWLTNFSTCSKSVLVDPSSANRQFSVLLPLKLEEIFSFFNCERENSDKEVEVTGNNNHKTVEATTIASHSLLHLGTGLKRAQRAIFS